MDGLGLGFSGSASKSSGPAHFKPWAWLGLGWAKPGLAWNK